MPLCSILKTGGGSRLVYTFEYSDTIIRIRQFAQKNFKQLDKKKFYFFHGFGKQVGEERLANYFHSKGYDIIQPERLPIDEQLNILANCENFASTVGSISHNTMFMPNGRESILIPRCCELNGVQQVLNQFNNTNAIYIDSTISMFSQGQHGGPFCYILSENLRKHFGDEIKAKYMEEDFVTFLKYLRYAKSRELKENPNELKYLKNILPEFFAQLKTRKDLMKKFGIVIN